jgi:hypothetical protein
VFPPTLVKEDEALPETADGRMDLTTVLRWGHDEPVVYCNPVLRSVNQCCFLGTFRLQTVNQPISLSSARFGSWPRQCSEQRSNFCEVCDLFCFLCVLASDANPLSIKVAGFSVIGDSTCD